MANTPTAFFGPRSKENARRLLALADSLGIDQRLIRTTAGGYLIPDEIEMALVAEAVAAQEAAEAAEAEAQTAQDLKEAADAADAAIKAVTEGEPEDVVEEGTAPAEPQARPAGNASRDAWATYAASTGVTFPEEATRGEIIALVDEKEGSN